MKKKTEIDLENPQIEKRVQKRTTELITLYSAESKDKIKTYRSLIEHLAFMDVMLQLYRQDIIENGYTVEYQNGKNQWGIKKNEAVDLFKKWYSERLTDSERLEKLITGVNENTPDEFDNFINRRKN